jgi:hypothetical protein
LLACVDVQSVWTLCRKHSLLRCLEQLLTLRGYRNRRVARSPLRARLSSRLRRRLSRSPPRFPLFHPQNVETNLDVAVYKTGHWALHLLPPRGHLISLHQVNNNGDGRGYYVGPTRWACAPWKSRLHEVTIFVGRIRWKHLRLVRRLMESWPVNNTDSDWCCRTWVWEILDELKKKGWLMARWRGLKRLREFRYGPRSF